MFPCPPAPIVLAVLLLLTASPLSAQTIRGQLLDLETDQPIDLGLIIMFTESGDSVTAALTNRGGHFSIRSPEPGSFLLLGSAFGYREAPAGVFELGEGGEMTVEFRLRPEPIAMEGLLVGVEARVFDHHLVRNGFVRRLQRGLGHFITPYEIEKSMARETESLFRSVPGVTVMSSAATDHLGEQVLMASSVGDRCAPKVFVDGIAMSIDYRAGERLSTYVPLATIEAVEVYRRPAEIPVEYGVTQGGGREGFVGGCGVLVFWTKNGPRFGAPPDRSAGPAADPGASLEEPGPPATGEQGPPPSAGERIRMALDPEVAASLGLGPIWEATFLSVREGEIVGSDVGTGRPVAVPMQGVEMLQVERERPFRYAVRRGVIAGSAFGVGSWLMLRILCGDSCAENDQAALPAALIGMFGGLLVGSQGPGTHWVGAPLPEGGSSPRSVPDRPPRGR